MPIRFVLPTKMMPASSWTYSSLSAWLLIKTPSAVWHEKKQVVGDRILQRTVETHSYLSPEYPHGGWSKPHLQPFPQLQRGVKPWGEMLPRHIMRTINLKEKLRWPKNLKMRPLGMKNLPLQAQAVSMLRKGAVVITSYYTVLKNSWDPCNSPRNSKLSI